MSNPDNASKPEISFWDQSITRITALVTIVGSIFGAGLWVGQIIADAKSQSEKSEISAKLAHAEADVKIHTAKVDGQVTQINAMNMERERLRSANDAQQLQIADLSQKLGLQSNCTFIHEQIRLTQAEIERPSFSSIMASGTKFDKEEAERKAELQQRLAGYQQQLGTCNR